MVSLETSLWARIHKEKCKRMLELCYAISKILLHSLSYRYHFFAFWLMLMIENRSMMFQDDDRTRIEAWIELETGFQYWLLLRIFQLCIWFLSAAWSLKALGLHSWICSQGIRSTKLNKIHGIQCFQSLILWNLFLNLFHM